MSEPTRSGGSGDRPTLVTMGLVYLGFAMPIAMLGVAWPSLRDQLDRPNAALGLLGAAYGIGRLSMSASGGVLLRRARFGVAGAVSIGVLGAASLAVASAPSWPLLLTAMLVAGLASGALDSLGARFIAAVGSVGVAGFLAGSYGIGATIGPALAAIGDRWQLAYVVAAVVCGAAALAVVRPGLRWPGGVTEERTASPAAVEWRTAPVLLSFLTLYAFIGIEVTMGQWTATYLEDAREIDGQVAGFAVSGFWGGVTIGRLLLGALGVGPRHLPVLALALAGAIVTVTVLPGVTVIAGAALVGLALSPMFPTLMASTADRVGIVAAPRVSGWQLIAGNVGATSMPALAGVAVALTDERAPMGVVLVAAVVGGLLLRRVIAVS